MSDKPVTEEFDHAISVVGVDKTEISNDGQFVSLICKGSKSESVFLDLPHEGIGVLIQLLSQAAGMAAKCREQQGDTTTSFPKSFTLINGFSIGGTPDGETVVLTLTAPDGLRFDFGIPARLDSGIGTRLVTALAAGLAQVPLPKSGAH